MHVKVVQINSYRTIHETKMLMDQCYMIVNMYGKVKQSGLCVPGQKQLRLRHGHQIKDNKTVETNSLGI